MQGPAGEMGLRVYDILGTPKLPAGQDTIGVRLLGHSPAEPQISKLGETLEAGSMRVWCLHPFVLGRGSLCSYHRGQGRSSHWETKLRGRSELAQDTPGGTSGFMQTHLLYSPASSPDLVFQVVKGPEPQRPSLRRGDSAPSRPRPHPTFWAPRSLPPAEAGLTWSLFQALRLAHLRP